MLYATCQEPQFDVKVLASVRSHSSCFVLLCVCVFSFFVYIAWAGRASLAAMDELTIIVLCAALAGIIVGSLGTLFVCELSLVIAT